MASEKSTISYPVRIHPLRQSFGSILGAGQATSSLMRAELMVCHLIVQWETVTWWRVVSAMIRCLSATLCKDDGLTWDLLFRVLYSRCEKFRVEPFRVIVAPRSPRLLQ
jgi:hypothetical protein